MGSCQYRWIGDFVCTTPNQTQIFVPPMHKTEVKLRGDVRYGPDDPTLWPLMSLVCSRREQTKTNLNLQAFSPQQNRDHSEERARKLRDYAVLKLEWENDNWHLNHVSSMCYTWAEVPQGKLLAKYDSADEIWEELVVADHWESVWERTIETKTYNKDRGWTNANCYFFRTSRYWLYTRCTE